RFGRRRRAQRLEIDDQHTVALDYQAVDLPGQDMALDQPDERHLSLRAGPKNRGEIRVAKHRERFAAKLVLLLGAQTVRRQREKPAGRFLMLLGRQLRQTLQQPVDEKPALETIAPGGPEQREDGRLGLARP